MYNPQGYAEREDKVDGKDRPVVAGSPSEAVYNFLWPQQAKQGKKIIYTLYDKAARKSCFFCVYMQSMSLSYRTKRVGENPYNTR